VKHISHSFSRKIMIGGVAARLTQQLVNGVKVKPFVRQRLDQVNLLRVLGIEL
jgi:hypothetical protein